MKTFLKIVGGVVCLALIVSAMYVVMVIGLSLYLHHVALASANTLQEHTTQLENKQLQDSIDSVGKGMDSHSEDKKYTDELAGKLPSLFVDPEGYDNEDNWLATMISREIAEMAFVTVQPKAQLPDLKIKALVTPDKPQVQVEIQGFATTPVTCDLTPAFAWDPIGYAPLASQLSGNTPGSPALPVSDENDILTHLLRLTGPNLASEDVRLSANLQEHPSSWQDHESAALLLISFALREHIGGGCNEIRPLLSRATAHLAVAQALRGNQPQTWPGLIADAGLRTLSGRELDALSHLDALTARSDLPDSAKTWITAFRVLAKQDWREATVTVESPLLLKITWLGLLCSDLFPSIARERLKAVVPQPPEDPNLPPSQQKTNPDTLITDWGRILGLSPFFDPGGANPDNADADLEVKSGAYNMDLEFHELDEILKIEGSPPFDLNNLPSIYSEKEADTISQDSTGKSITHIIGPSGFKGSSRRHIFNFIPSYDPTTSPSAEAQTTFTKFDKLLQGVPNYEMARIHTTFVDHDEYQKQTDAWVSAKKTWRIWEVPYQFQGGMPGYGLIKHFYRRAVPFGTVFEPGFNGRYVFINDINPLVWPQFNTPELAQIKKLPPQQAIGEIQKYTARYNVLLNAQKPKGPQPFEQELLKLNPDEYLLAVDHVPDDKLLPVASRFMDYCLNPIERIERLDDSHLSEADREFVLRKHVLLEPTFGFRTAVIFRANGKPDEAADMERKALAAWPANDIDEALGYALPLIDYDLNHNLNEEALKLAEQAGQTNILSNMGTYVYALDRLGRLDEAEAVAKRCQEIYSDDTWLTALQIHHHDRYPAIYTDLLKKTFPDGMTKAVFSDYSTSPKAGTIITNNSDLLKAAHLQVGDVIVALDGYQVNTLAQYYFIRALTYDPKMDFIIWRNGAYQEIQASVIARRLFVDLEDYKAE